METNDADDDFLDTAPHMSAGQLQMMAAGATSRMQVEGEAAGQSKLAYCSTRTLSFTNACAFSRLQFKFFDAV